MGDLPHRYIFLVDYNESMPSSQVLERLNEAITLCTHAYNLDTGNLNCLYQWGRAYLLLGDRVADASVSASWRFAQLASAICIFNRVLGRNPQHIGALNGMGQAYDIQAELLQDNAETLTTQFTPVMALRCAIQAYYHAYSIQLAHKTIVMRSPPNTPPASPSTHGEQYLDKRVSTVRREEDFISADALTSTVISLSDVLVRLAELYAECDESIWAQTASGLYTQAERLLAHAITEIPEHRVELAAKRAAVQTSAAKACAARHDTTEPGQFTAALEALEQAIRTAEEEYGEAPADLHFNLGDLHYYIAENRLAEMKAAASQTYDGSHNDHIQEHVLRTVILPHFAKAREAFRQGVRIDPENPVLQERLGDACFVGACVTLDATEEQQLLAEAERQYLNAYTLDSENDEAIVRLAQVYHRQHQWYACVDLLKRWCALGGEIQDLKREDNVFSPEFIAQAAAITHQYRL
jgi:tetratricopeptide (TPR) repeat protein